MPFFSRLWLAIVIFFKLLVDGALATRVQDAAVPRALPPAPAKEESALRLLALLQREGRLVDFVEEDLAGFPDAQVGAAARAVHAGCRKAIRESFAPIAVRHEAEGAGVTLEAGFDPAAVRLTGNVTGQPPFKGVLRHHGWRAQLSKLPVSTGDASLLAPAEVELP